MLIKCPHCDANYEVTESECDTTADCIECDKRIAPARLFLFSRLSDFRAIRKYTSREPRHLPIRAASGVEGNGYGGKRKHK